MDPLGPGQTVYSGYSPFFLEAPLEDGTKTMLQGPIAIASRHPNTACMANGGYLEDGPLSPVGLRALNPQSC